MYKKNNIMKGGLGKYSSYWNQNPDFEEENEKIKETLGLSLTYDPHKKSQFDYHSELLSKLLNINNGIINIDFINNFYRNIYYDVTRHENYDINTSIPGEFGIKISPDKVYTWEDDSKHKYRIVQTHIQPHGNTTIHILENQSDRTDKKVLKVFNSYDIIDSISMIKDYVSLEIIRNPNKGTEQPARFDSNYFEISDEVLDAYNFNMQSRFIKTENGNLLLASVNIDPINDYIINIIMQQIEKEIGIEQRFIKYNNLFVTSINTQTPPKLWGDPVNNYTWRYCILMDYMDGTIKDYLGTLPKATISEENKQRIIVDILQQSEICLDVFKNPRYLFTHTDFKVENLFYRSNPDGSINIYLGDFDKSSISYHSIRFYCFSKKYNRKTMGFDWWAGDNYMAYVNKDLKQINMANGQNHIYKISRSLKGMLENIEFEQMYMRYNFIPYYMSFDMCSLIMSLFHVHFIDGIGRKKTFIPELIKVLLRYIDGSTAISELFTIFNGDKTKFKGDFGKLITLLITSQEKLARNSVRFINILNIQEYVHINKLHLTKDRKICLTIPFTPNFHQFRYEKGIFETWTSTYTYQDKDDEKGDKNIDIIARNDYGELYDGKYKDFLDNFYLSSRDIKIEYNKDWTAITMLPGKPTFIVQTNRYSKLDYKYAKYVWDYSDFDKKNRQYILDFFMSTQNMDELINKNIYIDHGIEINSYNEVAKIVTSLEDETRYDSFMTVLVGRGFIESYKEFILPVIEKFRSLDPHPLLGKSYNIIKPDVTDIMISYDYRICYDKGDADLICYSEQNKEKINKAYQSGEPIQLLIIKDGIAKIHRIQFTKDFSNMQPNQYKLYKL
jgi:hypothetical protein